MLGSPEDERPNQQAPLFVEDVLLLLALSLGDLRGASHKTRAAGWFFFKGLEALI